MPLFDWIHSNLHDLNLDWIVNKIKNVETAEANSAASAADANAAKVAAAGSATAANNSKTAAAGSATAAAASAQTAQNLVDQLDTTIAADVETWLNTHVTPTSPIVDDTLTIQGAAADAKKTGDEITDLKSEIGMWYHKRAWVNVSNPYIQIDGSISKVYFKLVKPINGVSVTVNGSDDGWQTQHFVYFSNSTVFTAELNTSYDTFRFAVALPQAFTGDLEVIIHVYDDGHSVTQGLLDLKDQTAEQFNIEADKYGNLYVPTNALEGTNFNKYYLDGNKIKFYDNASFNVRQYSVEANKTYYIYGENVRLNANLTLCGFGTDVVANNVNIKEVIFTGTTTETNYVTRYTPAEDGYIYVAWVNGRNELSVYDTELVSEAFIKAHPEGSQKAIKIQLFGDSITDNQWGDLKTWADYIADNMTEYDVTVVNDAVGGSGLGHGKSTTTPSHQDDEYNYVYDLVTDGTTLQTDADVIVILCGTNNWASGSTLGNMSSTGYGSIYGALKGILEYISTHSKATVFVCTIPQRYNTVDQGRETNAYGEPLNPAGITLSEYCEPFRILSAFYGMPCVHLNEALGWNRLNITNFCADGLHPNQTGDKMLAKFICSEIKKHI